MEIDINKARTKWREVMDKIEEHLQECSLSNKIKNLRIQLRSDLIEYGLLGFDRNYLVEYSYLRLMLEYDDTIGFKYLSRSDIFNEEEKKVVRIRISDLSMELDDLLEFMIQEIRYLIKVREVYCEESIYSLRSIFPEGEFTKNILFLYQLEILKKNDLLYLYFRGGDYLNVEDVRKIYCDGCLGLVMMELKNFSTDTYRMGLTEEELVWGKEDGWILDLKEEVIKKFHQECELVFQKKYEEFSIYFEELFVRLVEDKKNGLFPVEKEEEKIDWNGWVDGYSEPIFSDDFKFEHYGLTEIKKYWKNIFPVIKNKN